MANGLAFLKRNAEGSTEKKVRVLTYPSSHRLNHFLAMYTQHLGFANDSTPRKIANDLAVVFTSITGRAKSDGVSYIPNPAHSAAPHTCHLCSATDGDAL